MNNLKVWPHLTIVAVVCAVLAGGGVALWMKHEQTASANALPNAARIQRVEGEVALNNTHACNAENPSNAWNASRPFPRVGDPSALLVDTSKSANIGFVELVLICLKTLG